jgi:predicted nucleic acid-binding protein
LALSEIQIVPTTDQTYPSDSKLVVPASLNFSRTAVKLGDSRKKVAKRLIVEGGTIGIQTLNEFVNVERYKLKVSWSGILDWLRIIDKLCPTPIPLTAATHNRGLQIAQASGYHIYDSLMLAAAIEASCTVFYSEDMHDRHAIESLTIRNPFG